MSSFILFIIWFVFSFAGYGIIKGYRKKEIENKRKIGDFNVKYSLFNEFICIVAGLSFILILYTAMVLFHLLKQIRFPFCLKMPKELKVLPKNFKEEEV